MSQNPRDAPADPVRPLPRPVDRPVSKWHPLLAAREVRSGEWHMMSASGERYGIIRALEIGGERGYRAVTGADAPAERRLIGYFRTLRAAAERTHRRWLDGHARAGGVNGT